MSPVEIRAFNAGIRAVLDLAQASADAMTARLLEKPTRWNFAAGALQSIADEGRALLKDQLGQDPAEGEPAPNPPKPTVAGVAGRASVPTL